MASVNRCQPAVCCFQLRSSFASQAIEFGVAATLGLFPVGNQQAAIFEAVQRGIKRALRYLNHVTRDLLEPLRNGVAVDGAESDNLENRGDPRSPGADQILTPLC